MSWKLLSISNRRVTLLDYIPGVVEQWPLRGRASGGGCVAILIRTRGWIPILTCVGQNGEGSMQGELLLYCFNFVTEKMYRKESREVGINRRSKKVFIKIFQSYIICRSIIYSSLNEC